jgi:beta-N-acetylhexosaminidase
MVLSRCLLAVLLLSSISAEAAVAAKSKPKAKPKATAAGSPSDVAARRILKSLNLHDKAAQLVMVQFYGEALNTRSKAYKDLLRLVQDARVGGLIVLNRTENGSVHRAEPYAMAAFLNRMQKAAKTPLLVGGDFERGASMRLNSTATFPHAMAFGAAGDLEATRALARATVREARAVGVQWVFAPVADVNNNPDNPIINNRSFSENPEVVAAHVTAFIEAGQKESAGRVLLCVKHFPGHGDTSTDSHLGLATVTADLERLESVELVPFKAAITHGVDSVMTAHLSVPALESEPIPATVSHAIITGLLREQFGFRGLISTDAMNMLGLSKQFSPGEAAVRALEAGVDLLLIPANPVESIRGVVEAVRSGRISEKRLDESVLRVLSAKVRVGLYKNRLVDLEKIADLVNTPEDEELARSVAERALTAVKNENNVLPLAHPDKACYLVAGAGRFSQQGREFIDELRKRAPQARAWLLDPQLPKVEFDELAQTVSTCDAVVLAAYVSAVAFKGDIKLNGNYPGFVDQLLAAKPPVVFVSLGNPYLLRAYPTVAAYVATFSTTPSSEEATVRALFGEIPIRGHLPVTIPGLARYGEGLEIPAKSK